MSVDLFLLLRLPAQASNGFHQAGSCFQSLADSGCVSGVGLIVPFDARGLKSEDLFREALVKGEKVRASLFAGSEALQKLSITDRWLIGANQPSRVDAVLEDELATLCL